MYRKIIVGYDGSDQAEDALALGRRLATASGAVLVVAGVYHFEPFFDTVGWGDTPRPADIRAEREKAVLEQIGAAAPEATARAVGGSSPAHGLQQLVEEMSADLVVVGSCRRGRLGRILAGSVGERLLHGSPCAIAVAPVGYGQRQRLARRPGRDLGSAGCRRDGGRVTALRADSHRAARRRLAAAQPFCRLPGTRRPSRRREPRRDRRRQGSAEA